MAHRFEEYTEDEESLTGAATEIARQYRLNTNLPRRRLTFPTSTSVVRIGTPPGLVAPLPSLLGPYTPTAPPVYHSKSPEVADTSSQVTPKGGPKLALRPPLPKILDQKEIEICYSHDPRTPSFVKYVMGNETGRSEEVNPQDSDSGWETWFALIDRGSTLRADDINRFIEGQDQYVSCLQDLSDVHRNMMQRLHIGLLRLTANTGGPWFEGPQQRVWLERSISEAYAGAIQQTQTDAAAFKRKFLNFSARINTDSSFHVEILVPDEPTRNMSFYLCQDFHYQICAIAEKHLHRYGFRDIERDSVSSPASAMHNYLTTMKLVDSKVLSFLQDIDDDDVSHYLGRLYIVSHKFVRPLLPLALLSMRS
jgi:hypothetical protein